MNRLVWWSMPFLLGLPRVATAQQALGLAAEDAQGNLQGWYVGVEVHASFLSDIRGLSNLLPTFGYAVKGGHRWNDRAAFLHVEHNLWYAMESGKQGLSWGALNLGAGYDSVYARGQVHSSVAVGPSVLLESTPLDRAGHVGLFAEFRPMGLRWKGTDRQAYVLDPLSLAVVAPVLGGIPLVHIQYRTTLGVEVLP